MCVRRFLALIFTLTLIVVGGAFALYQWGGNVLLKSATPQGHFVAPPPRSGPDYTSSDAWIARPSMANDPSRWYPELYSNGKDRYLGNMPPPTKIAAFYIHPTTYLERNHWSAPIDHPESRNRADGLAHATEQALGELGEKVSGSDRAAVESALSDLRTAIKGDDKEAIDRKADALVNASQRVMAAAQQAAQGGGANASADAGAQPGGGGQNDNDNVVDAEFEEVKDKDRKA
jgi:hypothetical protein